MYFELQSTFNNLQQLQIAAFIIFPVEIYFNMHNFEYKYIYFL